MTRTNKLLAIKIGLILFYILIIAFMLLLLSYYSVAQNRIDALEENVTTLNGQLEQRDQALQILAIGIDQEHDRITQVERRLNKPTKLAPIKCVLEIR